VSRAAPAWRQTTGRVLARADAGVAHHWLELEVEPPFEAPRPGQFVQLLLGGTSPALLPRPMSVTGVACRRGALRLRFLFASVGTGTRMLAALGPGALVEVLGPLGRGFPLAASGTPVLVAGGRGVAPLLFAADTLTRGAAGARGREAGDRLRRRPVLLFGARSRAELVGLADARRRLAAIGGRLHVCTDDGSSGPKGNVVSLLERVAARLAPPLVVHACGPHAMLKAVARWAIPRGVPAFVAMESVMACGTGVCRGCPLPRSAAGRAAFDRAAVPVLHGNRDWAMCCTEGPVFAAGDLDWERIE
jgi:dihydroorotate dehydrogenase electron transfer subunit